MVQGIQKWLSPDRKTKDLLVPQSMRLDASAVPDLVWHCRIFDYTVNLQFVFEPTK